MKLTPYLLLAIGVAHAAPQGILSEIASAFGFGDDPTSTARSKTLIPPATVRQTSLGDPTSQASITSSGFRISLTAAPTPTPTPSSTDTDTDSSTITSILTTTNTTTSTPPPSTTTTSSSTTAQPAVSTPTPTPAPAPSSSSVSPAGIAVAVVLTLAVFAVVIWLIFRYHPGLRGWWDEREEKRMKERSYRDAIDGPFARGRGNGVRNQALGSRKSMLASFFAPRTVHLGEGKEIRRKPVNWGVDSPPLPGKERMDMASTGLEKVALTNMAAPMARSESVVSSASYHSSGANSNGVLSARSSPAIPQKELPPMPPVPAVPGSVASPRPARLAVGAPVELDSQPRQRDKGIKDKKLKGAGGGDVHNILSRKSIFELA